jgi:hypothetical protein
MVCGAEVAVCYSINKKHIVGRAYNCWMLNLLVHHVTRLWKVNMWALRVLFLSIFYPE